MQKTTSVMGRARQLIALAVAASLCAAPTLAQPQPGAQKPTPVKASATATSFTAQQLDALLAPVALYPDTLLTQMMMAATFPVQIVQAARWLDSPANKALTGDPLAKALQTQSWDPSVKSLLPVPQVVVMMADQADWTQQLGYAFSVQQADVLAAVQRLRTQAQTAGTLKSNPQLVVRTEPRPQTAAASPPIVIIESPNPQVIYVPAYNPATAYGVWAYPAYPPVALPPPPGYAVGSALVTGLAFGAGVALTSSLWNVGSPNWGRGDVDVNVNRYNSINTNRTQINSSTWQANRANTVNGRATRPPSGPVGRPATGSAARQTVRVPASTVNRPQAQPQAQQQSRQQQPRQQQRQQPQRPSSFSGVNDGNRANDFANRGAQSRQFQQDAAPRGNRGQERGDRTRRR